MFKCIEFLADLFSEGCLVACICAISNGVPNLGIACTERTCKVDFHSIIHCPMHLYAEYMMASNSPNNSCFNYQQLPSIPIYNSNIFVKMMNRKLYISRFVCFQSAGTRFQVIKALEFSADLHLLPISQLHLKVMHVQR